MTNHEPSLKRYLNIRKTFLFSRRMVLKNRKILLSDNFQVSVSQLVSQKMKKTAFVPTCLAQKAKIKTDDFQQTK